MAAAMNTVIGKFKERPGVRVGAGEIQRLVSDICVEAEAETW